MQKKKEMHEASLRPAADQPGAQGGLPLPTRCHERAVVSEENRRYSDGKIFHSRYTLYNVRIGFILDERELLVVFSRR